MAVGKTAKLTLQLVDGVTGPARAIVGALGTVNSATRMVGSAAMAPARGITAMARGIRQATYNIAPAGAAISIGIEKVADDVYELERQLNISQAAGDLGREQRIALMRKAVDLNKDYAATSAQIVAGANELLKAGFTFDQAIGAMNGILDTAQAMDVPISEASSAVVNSMTSMRLAMGTTDETFASSRRMADLFAQAVNQTTASLEDFSTSGKYFNPVAAAMKMSAEEAMAWQMTLAKAGIMGSSAGTGLRSAPIAIAAPTKGARAALAALGIDNNLFMGGKTGDANGSAVAGVMEALGYNAEGVEEAIDKMIADPAFKKSPAKLASAIVQNFADQIGAVTGQDRGELQTSITTALTNGVSDIDMIGFLKELKAKGAGVDDYAAVFGKNHASKMMAIDPAEFERMLALAESSAGVATRMREAMMAGIVGDVAEFTAAIEKMSVAIGQSGLLADASKLISGIADSVSRLADTNPMLLRFAAYAALAIAAIAPLGFAITGVATVLALVVNPLAWVVAGLGSLAAINLKPISEGIRAFGFGFMKVVDPAIVARVRAMTESAGSLFSAFKMRDLGLVGPGMNFGTMLAQAINTGSAALPKLKALGDGIVEFGEGAIARVTPQIKEGAGSLRNMLAGFVDSKVATIQSLTTALYDFGSKALPALSPAAAEGLRLVAESFRTMAAGGELLGTLLGTAQTALVSFATALLEKISPETMESAGRGIEAVLTAITGPVKMLGDGFRDITESITGAEGSITSFASMAGGKLGDAFNAIATLIRPGVDALVAIFQQVVAMIQSVKDAFTSLSNMSVSLPSISGATAAAVNPGGSAASAGAMIGAMAPKAPSLPGKATGGAVRRGLTYQVGERGPETVTMGTNSYVTPNHRQGGRGGDTHIWHITGSNAEEIARKVEQRLARGVGRSAQFGINR